MFLYCFACCPSGPIVVHLSLICLACLSVHLSVCLFARALIYLSVHAFVCSSCVRHPFVRLSCMFCLSFVVCRRSLSVFVVLSSHLSVCHLIIHSLAYRLILFKSTYHGLPHPLVPSSLSSPNSLLVNYYRSGILLPAFA